LILIVITSLVAGVCLYLVWAALCAGDSGGAWLFAAFAFLFGLPALTAGARIIKRRLRGTPPNGGNETAPQSVRFVPHWQLMAMLIIALVVIVAALAVSFFK